jgi:Zn-dependent protease with chaperone function
MKQISIDQIRHEKETTYLTIMYAFSIILYILACIPLVAFAVIGFPFLLIFILSSWLVSLYFKAYILGNFVKVNENQYPEIYNTVLNYCSLTQMTKLPQVFIYNGEGVLNAFALKVFLKKYIMLSSSIVDLSYKKGVMDELNFVIGHEIGHHAAKHTSIRRSVLTGPAKILPFLGAAYSRACELTADRYGLVLSNNKKASLNALINLAHGSRVLSLVTNFSEFEHQEEEIPEFMGFISKIYATHPRLTVRVKHIRLYTNSSTEYQTRLHSTYTQVSK